MLKGKFTLKLLQVENYTTVTRLELDKWNTKHIKTIIKQKPGLCNLPPPPKCFELINNCLC